MRFWRWEKLLSLLRVRSLSGGLEISDAILHLAFFDGERWRLAGARLAPGVMESNRIKDYAKFVAALKSLKTDIFGPSGAKRKMNVVVSLSSLNIYTQVFSLPIIEGENLDKAIQLNIQMVSPVETSEAYSGWQLVGQDQGSLRLEVLSAFIERAVVDEINKALFEAGFISVAMESRALALARLSREEGVGIDLARSYIVLSLDNSGLDFVVVRNGQLYFEYFNPWKDIMDERGQIPMLVFEAEFTRSLQQVLNFYGQHWTEPISEVIVSATALSDKVGEIIKNNFSLPVRELSLKNVSGIGPEWFVALGCGLRGLKPRSKDKEVSLLGVGAEEQFRREQFIEFLRLWRVLVPVALGVLLAAFALADAFTLETAEFLETGSVISLTSEQQRELNDLTAKAQEFNASAAMIKSVEDNWLFKTELLGKIDLILSSSSVSLDRFAFQSKTAPVFLSGFAKSENLIINFKNALEADSEFTSVNLALTDIKPDPRGGYSFSLTFSLK